MVLIATRSMDMTDCTPSLRPWLGNELAARTLRAAGMSEDCLAGEWSDYDTLEALCAALPLLHGHPVGAGLTAWLREVTACDLPACAENAPAFWQSYAIKCGYGAPVQLPDGYRPCFALPTLSPPEIWQEPETENRLGEWVWRELTAKIAPHGGRLLAACTEGLEPWWGIHNGAVWLDLPRGLPFVRPDPYHAELALQGLSRGDTLTKDERGLLIAQLARTAGQGMTHQPENTATLVLTGGNADSVLALCRYLDGCGGLPPTVWLADDPADAAILCGQFAAVRTGLRLTSSDTAEDVRNKLTAYAAAAPIGRIVLEVPDSSVSVLSSEEVSVDRVTSS